MEIPWNKLIAAVEYMNVGELNELKDKEFDIKVTKGKVTITVKT